ncbi:MAG TPA: DUF72 domain-containing protein [Bryobacteraceae bacterium]|jgi:uncharacterized protein YecE (DUF72 family)|nr:DUF72 domain-containing protein [Bryobacteraceae bacterium]
MNEAAEAALHIGTSGWHYKHWVGRFYPERTPASKMLALYQQQFDTVELNNSFYHLPKRPALENWRDSTPPGFCFAVKGSRFLTHMKKLKDAEAGVQKFLDAVEVLGEKLGPILFQLPPNWEADAARLRSFLQILPAYHRYAFEFRNATWERPEIYALLREFRAANCIFDLAGYQSPVEVTTDFAYIRLHGPGGKYQGSYSDTALAAWAERIRRWRSELLTVYVYFDNDDSGYAAHNALRLKELLRD